MLHVLALPTTGTVKRGSGGDRQATVTAVLPFLRSVIEQRPVPLGVTEREGKAHGRW